MKHRIPAALTAVCLAATPLVTGCDFGKRTHDDGKRRVVYVPAVTGVPFYNTVGCGAKSMEAKLGVHVDVQGPPEFDPAKQSAIVSALIADKPDAIMISVADAKALIPPLMLAKEAGIKIIGIDGDVADKSLMTTNIISNNIKGGAAAAEQMVRLTGGKGEVMGLNNDPGNPLGEAREKGFVDTIKKHPGMKYLGTQYSKNETARAASITSSASSSNRKLVGVYAMSTTNSEGAVTGLRESGRGNQVKIIGFDISDPIETALRNRQIAGVIVQHPFEEGRVGVRSAIDAAEGRKVPRNQHTDFAFATPDNLNTPRLQKYVYKKECGK